LFAKARQYFFDMGAVKKAVASSSLARVTQNDGAPTFGGSRARIACGGTRTPDSFNPKQLVDLSGRNLRNSDLWYESIDAPYGLCGVDDELVGVDANVVGIKEDHFAAFPEQFVLSLVKCGTSQKGCCPACGKSWRRVVERQRSATRPARNSKVIDKRNVVGDGAAQVVGNRDPERHITHTMTIGWRPDCECYNTEIIGDFPRGTTDTIDNEYASVIKTWRARWDVLVSQYARLKTVPCTILDPFSGSGTTGIVAIKNARRYIGIELNDKYIEMSLRRLRQAETQRGFGF
jgi:hypothetical protein